MDNEMTLGPLGTKTYEELISALGTYAIHGNTFAVKNVVREMASRRGLSATKMAVKIRRGEMS